MRACLVRLMVGIVMHILWHDCLHKSKKEFQQYETYIFKFPEHMAVLLPRETVVLQQDATTNLHGERNVRQKDSVHLHSEQRSTSKDASKRRMEPGDVFEDVRVRLVCRVKNPNRELVKDSLHSGELLHSFTVATVLS